MNLGEAKRNSPSRTAYFSRALGTELVLANDNVFYEVVNFADEEQEPDTRFREMPQDQLEEAGTYQSEVTSEEDHDVLMPENVWWEPVKAAANNVPDWARAIVRSITEAN